MHNRAAVIRCRTSTRYGIRECAAGRVWVIVEAAWTAGTIPPSATKGPLPHTRGPVGRERRPRPSPPGGTFSPATGVLPQQHMQAATQVPPTSQHLLGQLPHSCDDDRSEERRVGKECRTAVVRS